MSLLPTDIVELVEAEKSLGARPKWDNQSDPRYAVFTHPLTFGGITIGGFQLRMKVSKRWVDRDAMMQLEFAPAGKRTEEKLWRLDWKPLHTHDNKGNPKELAFATLIDSHQHSFADNFLENERRMRAGNLPAARPFPNNPNALSDFVAFGGKLFRIKDIERIELPQFSPDMFWKEDD